MKDTTVNIKNSDFNFSVCGGVRSVYVLHNRAVLHLSWGPDFIPPPLLGKQQVGQHARPSLSSSLSQRDGLPRRMSFFHLGSGQPGAPSGAQPKQQQSGEAPRTVLASVQGESGSLLTGVSSFHSSNNVPKHFHIRMKLSQAPLSPLELFKKVLGSFYVLQSPRVLQWMSGSKVVSTPQMGIL